MEENTETKKTDLRIETIQNLRKREFLSEEACVKTLSSVLSINQPTRILSFSELIEGIKALAVSGALDRELALSCIKRVSEYEIIGKTERKRTKTSITDTKHLFGRGVFLENILEAVKRGNNTYESVTNYIATKHGLNRTDIYDKVYNNMKNDALRGYLIKKGQEYYLSDEDDKKSKIVPGKYESL